MEENITKITTDIDAMFYDELKTEATRRGISVSTMLHIVLSAYFIPQTDRGQ